jgi:energy-coupling factor transporter ATP-binding protein EcfA2
MKLDKLILANWGQLPYGEYEFSNMTLLTGPTGAGKSTMLDALQTVMTASYQGIVAYNPGQEEVQGNQRRGKSKRTLESFVCGAEYSRFSRPDGAQGYVAAVFRPGPKEGLAKPFTALVAASARVDGIGERRGAKLERLELVIVDDEALSIGDFLKDAESNEWVAVDDIVKRLKARYRKVTSYDGTKKDYLCALYGRFRGRNSVTWDETQNAAKAWSQSIAYKPIGSVHDLVREDILEFDGKQLQESITRISDLMKQVTNLREEGARIAATVARLSELKAAINSTTAAFEEQVQYDLLAARVHLRDDQARIDQERQKIASDTEIAERNLAAKKTQEALKQSADASRIELKVKLGGIAAHGAKERLEEKLRLASQLSKDTLEALTKGLLEAARLENAARQLIGKPIPEQFPALRAAVEAVARTFAATELERLAALRDSVLDAARDEELVPTKLLQLVAAFEGANEGLAEVHAALVGPTDSVSMAIAAESATLDARIEAEQRGVRDLADRKQRLAAGASNYPRDTAYAVDRIREHLPEASVQVLCDLVEPKSEAWQPAIEGYLDFARFNLIVKPDYEAATIDYLQSINSRAKVIQGKQCLDKADPNRVPRDSIIHELHTDHPIAKAYLIEQYGTVVKVETSQQLRSTLRGLTKDGKGSGSRTMFVVDKRELVFGRAARERALRDTTAQLEAAEVSLARLRDLKKWLGDLRGALQVREPNFNAQPLEAAATDIDHARRSLSQLDLTEVLALEAALKAVEEQIADHQRQITAAEKAITLADERTGKSEEAIRGIQARRGERLRDLEDQIRRLKQLCEVNPERTYTVLAEQVEDLLNSGATSVEVNSRRDFLRSVPATRLGDVRELLTDFNAKAKSEERFHVVLPHLADTSAFDPCYGPLAQLGREVSQRYAELEGVGLYNNRNEVEKAERSFHDVFTKQFCVEIKTKVDDGVRTLRQLNAELQNLKFGTDRFSIDWSKWEPEFADFYDFFKAVTELADSPETVDLFGDTELSEKHIAVRKRIVDLLLDKDQERAARELGRIADYRNYRRYEIWNESDSGGRIALSTWGTGSGGQLETPAYIVRAAVVTNRMRLFDKGASLRLLVSDESFSKMDETRARAVLRYLRDSLDLQVVSAMPTRNAGGLRPEFDREYSYSRASVDKNGELDFILECDERVFKSDKMRELWDAQRLEAREQARLEFEQREPAETTAPADLVAAAEVKQ